MRPAWSKNAGNFALVKNVMWRLRALPDVHMVGGTVRDLHLGREPRDIDVATSATVPEIKMLVRGLDGVTVTFVNEARSLVGLDVPIAHGCRAEVTTFRARRGGDIQEDLASRDLTVNAMAVSINDMDWVIDPHGGRRDLKRRVLRAVGSPEDRLEEDPGRAFRVARLSGQLGFKIDPDLMDACVRSAHLVADRVSAPRICLETRRAFAHAGKSMDFVTLIDRMGLLRRFFGDGRLAAYPDGWARDFQRQLERHAPPDVRWSLFLGTMVGRGLFHENCIIKDAAEQHKARGVMKAGRLISAALRGEIEVTGAARRKAQWRFRHIRKTMRDIEADLREQAPAPPPRALFVPLYEEDRLRPVVMGRHLVDAGIPERTREIGVGIRAAHEHQLESDEVLGLDDLVPVAVAAAKEAIKEASNAPA